MPGELKLDHLHPFKPLLFLLPQRANTEERKSSMFPTQQDKYGAAGLQILLEVIDLVLCELLPRSADDEDSALREGVQRDVAVLAVARDLPVALINNAVL